MFYAMPVEAPPVACEVTPYKATLFADAAKKARVNLPPNSMLRKCSAPGEGWRVFTRPDSGGTTACVFYEFHVDPKDPALQIGARKTAVAKSLKNAECPAVDHSARSYPGKDWFFLSDNVPLENAYKVKARVESAGLAFLNEEKAKLKDPKQAVDFGNTPLGVYAISAAESPQCRKKDGFFQERFAACYKVDIYNQAVRGGWSLYVALRKKGEYKFIHSKRVSK